MTLLLTLFLLFTDNNQTGAAPPDKPPGTATEFELKIDAAFPERTGRVAVPRADTELGLQIEAAFPPTTPFAPLALAELPTPNHRFGPMMPPGWHVSPSWMVASPPVPPTPYDPFSTGMRPPEELPPLFPCSPVALVPVPAPAPMAEAPGVQHVNFADADAEANAKCSLAKTDQCPAGCPLNPATCPLGPPGTAGSGHPFPPQARLWERLHAGHPVPPPHPPATAVFERFYAGHPAPPHHPYPNHPGHPVPPHYPMYHPIYHVTGQEVCDEEIGVCRPFSHASIFTGTTRPHGSEVTEFPGAKNVQRLVRATYEVPHETAKTLQPVLESGAGVLECVVDGDELTVNATYEAQAAIAQFLAKVVKGNPMPIRRPARAVSVSHVQSQCASAKCECNADCKCCKACKEATAKCECTTCKCCKACKESTTTTTIYSDPTGHRKIKVVKPASTTQPVRYHETPADGARPVQPTAHHARPQGQSIMISIRGTADGMVEVQTSDGKKLRARHIRLQNPSVQRMHVEGGTMIIEAPQTKPVLHGMEKPASAPIDALPRY